MSTLDSRAEIGACEVSTGHHSTDTMRVFHGRTEPIIVCGFHLHTRGLQWCLDHSLARV